MQQSAGGHQKSGAAVKTMESASGFKTGSSRGVQRRKREKRRVQRLREHREGRHSSGCDAPWRAGARRGSVGVREKERA